MAKRAPPSKVAAFPVWRGRLRDSAALIETTEHPDTGQWWVRQSFQQHVPMRRGDRIERVQTWCWGAWVPAKEPPQIDRNWRIQRPHYPGSLSARPGRYRKAMLPVETEIPR